MEAGQASGTISQRDQTCRGPHLTRSCHESPAAVCGAVPSAMPRAPCCPSGVPRAHHLLPEIPEETCPAKESEDILRHQQQPVHQDTRRGVQDEKERTPSLCRPQLAVGQGPPGPSSTQLKAPAVDFERLCILATYWCSVPVF
ncbi:hypothetical protein NDU88_001842 [Pleurodeles waltl]|uniref:Uncharacterized protein n=1 Tax=Pleurodeles waltl TaxID=8319 RepID=A0AAV7U7J7_PLEWA|nr:hypothetical protein NDU88_001842 [Pleurodeles waltl]